MSSTDECNKFTLVPLGVVETHTEYEENQKACWRMVISPQKFYEVTKAKTLQYTELCVWGKSNMHLPWNVDLTLSEAWRGCVGVHRCILPWVYGCQSDVSQYCWTNEPHPFSPVKRENHLHRQTTDWVQMVRRDTFASGIALIRQMHWQFALHTKGSILFIM